MLALIYLALAIYLGDLLCLRFYRFVSTPHRWAAATLVGILLSTWFTYLVGLAFAHTSEPLLWADLLFFVVTSGAIFLLSRNSPGVQIIEPRAPGRALWDWITLAALFVAACFLLIGTLYTNRQGRLRLSGMEVSDFAPLFAIAQNFAFGHNFPTKFSHHAGQPNYYHFPFYFQAGNLNLLGLNLPWSVDVLGVAGLISMLALVMALGQLLFNSRIVGRVGATLFFFHGSLLHLTSFLLSRSPHRTEILAFWKQIAFVNQRHLPFAVGVFLLVLIFLVDWYCQRASAKSFLFSGLVVAAVPLWNAPVVVAGAVVLFCLLVAYGLWWLSTLKNHPMLGRILAGTVTACILVAGVSDLLAVYSSPRLDVNYEKEPLVKGLVFRNLVIYKIPDSAPPRFPPERPRKPSTTVFGGYGNGNGQFDGPRGIAIDSAGNIFVADTNNGRIEKFSPSGAFVASIGQFDAPNGIAIDRSGNIYVAEVGFKHRVQKLASDGTFVAKWAPGFYGPRRIAIGPDDSIYVVDSGRNRIVKFSPDGQVLASWGSEGNGDGQFKGLSSVAVDPVNSKVYVADPINSRTEIFDLNGKFLTKWSIPEWGRPNGFEDLAVNSKKHRVYASSANMNRILVFDLDGNRVGTLTPEPPYQLNEPSAIAIATDKLFVLNTGSARVSVIPLPAE
jgi:sugar lactone lactonase YvrE